MCIERGGIFSKIILILETKKIFSDLKSLMVYPSEIKNITKGEFQQL